jgi:protocatechuate 3,4-dioxygenase beta subunit
VTSRTLLAALLLLAALAGAGAWLLLGGEVQPAPSPAGGAPVSRPSGPEPVRELPAPAQGPLVDAEAPRAGPLATAIDVSAAPAVATGRVIDRSGLALSGARVQAFAREDDPPFRTRRDLPLRELTGADGRFRLVGLPAGPDLGLDVEHDEHAPTLREPFRMKPGADVDLGDIVLEQGLVLHGTVSEPSSRPLAGATLALRDAAALAREGPGPEARTTVAAADGSYAFEHIAGRQYELEASAEGHGTESVVISLMLGAARAEWRQDFVLRPADAALAGLVLGPDDLPVPGVPLLLSRSEAGSHTYFLRRSAADADGAFLFEQVPGGVYLVDLQDGEHYLDRPVQVQAGRDDNLVRAQRGLVVHGRLAAPELPARFRLAIQPDGRTGAGLLGRLPHEREVAGTSGEFEVRGLRPGAYRFEVTADGYAPSSSGDVLLGQGQPPAEVLVTLLRGGEVAGRLSPPQAGVSAELREAEWDPASPIESAFPTQPAYGLRAETGDDGAFRFAHVPPGRYVLTLHPPGAPPLHLRDVEAREGELTDVGALQAEPGGAIVGSVTGPDGRPRQGVRVTVVSDRHQAAAQTDAEGAFRFDTLPAGAYEVHATPGGLWEALRFAATQQVELRAGAEESVALTLVERAAAPR